MPVMPCSCRLVTPRICDGVCVSCADLPPSSTPSAFLMMVMGFWNGQRNATQLNAGVSGEQRTLQGARADWASSKRGKASESQAAVWCTADHRSLVVHGLRLDGHDAPRPRGRGRCTLAAEIGGQLHRGRRRIRRSGGRGRRRRGSLDVLHRRILLVDLSLAVQNHIHEGGRRGSDGTPADHTQDEAYSHGEALLSLVSLQARRAGAHSAVCDCVLLLLRKESCEHGQLLFRACGVRALEFAAVGVVDLGVGAGHSDAAEVEHRGRDEQVLAERSVAILQTSCLCLSEELSNDSSDICNAAATCEIRCGSAPLIDSWLGHVRCQCSVRAPHWSSSRTRPDCTEWRCAVRLPMRAGTASSLAHTSVAHSTQRRHGSRASQRTARDERRGRACAACCSQVD